MSPLFWLFGSAFAGSRPIPSVSLGTDFPVMVGARMEAEFPSRARVALGAGLMPKPYVNTINGAMTSFDIYSDSVADLIDLALKRSLVAQIEGGWRPWERRGWVFYGGYQFIGLGGDSSDISVFGEAMDPRLLQAASGVTGDATVGVANHQLSLRAGHEWVIRDHFLIGTSIGFAGTIATRSKVDFTEEVGGPGAEAVRTEVGEFGAQYLDFVFEEWVHLPMVGLWLGYRFGGDR